MDKIKELHDKLVRLHGESQAILEKAKVEDNRDLTADETQRVNALAAEYDAAQSQKAALEAVADMGRRNEEQRVWERQSAGRPCSSALTTAPAEGTGQRQTRGNGSDQRQRFGSFGAYAQAVAQMRKNGEAFERVKVEAGAATTFGNEALDSEGAALVPAEYMTAVATAIGAGDSLLPLTDQITIQGNSMAFPADENTPWGTTGILAYWQQEGVAGTQVRPNLKTKAMRLNKLMCLIPVTEELLEDAVALESYLTQKAADAILWKINDAIVNGTGVGQPQGIKNAASLITQTKEGSQTAATINANNVGKMLGRLIPSALSGAAWLIAPDAYNQLITMSVSNQPIWTPPNAGIQQAPAGSLLGRPVIISMTCQTLGTAGDIYLGGFKAGYRTIVKAGGVKGAISAHLFFDADTTAFRFTFRMDGLPWLQAAVSAAYGSSTLGHFVTMETRS